MRVSTRIVLCFTFGLLGGLSPGQAWAEEKNEPKVYSEDFAEAEVGSEPGSIMVLEGNFSVQNIEGKNAFVLPGEPVGDFGFLFGPRLPPAGVISATITAEKKGRRMPRFGIGWGGQNGLKLFANPAAKKLELFDNQTKLGEAPLAWESGRLLFFNLILEEEQGEWWAKAHATRSPKSIKARADEAAFLKVKLPAPPRPGRASVWAQPFSGLPIRVENLMVKEMPAS